jgi:hypothetical protein
MSKLDIYVQTYNAPEQLELWCESFLKAYPSEFSNLEKFVIDNSDQSSFQDKNDEVRRKYNLKIVHVGKNLGICGGRHLAAKHFNQSVADYMIYFEDDMLMRDADLSFCKSGFKTYHKELFNDIPNIIKRENIHFLKLCFTEVYGTNHRNWSKMSLSPDDIRQIEQYDVNGIFLSPNVCIDYTDTYNGLAYAIGAYHYCNWPIAFSKEGNRIIFIDSVIPVQHELAWTRVSYINILNGSLRAGCLLASPIRHLRQIGYAPNERIENEAGLQIKGATICFATND